MTDIEIELRRIAAALERLGPPRPDVTDWSSAPAWQWQQGRAVPVHGFAPRPLNLLSGIDAQKEKLLENTCRHAEGRAAHDALLWGARGMGKSALVAACVGAARDRGGNLTLVQASGSDLASLPGLFAALARAEGRFIVFTDDIGFEDDEAQAVRSLRSILEGGVAARPAHVRLYATSNRRNIVARSMKEQDDPVNPRDVLDDRLALADRFGLSLGFHNCTQDEYLAIISGYAKAFGLQFDEADALRWSKQRGARSGRIAWHFVVELAGGQGVDLY